MSADERKQEMACLTNQVEVAKATAEKLKENLTACQAALKAASTAEEKAAASEACKVAAQAVKEATEKVAEAVKADRAFRGAVVQADAKAAAAADPFVVLAKQYAKHYPACDTFHITSDKQVFLDVDKSLATYHQRSLGEGEVQTIKVR